jgi:crotonobetainyl-CoA:carnitine CoA-transferase CaiB-like acyl-CoA transferase
VVSGFGFSGTVRAGLDAIRRTHLSELFHGCGNVYSVKLGVPVICWQNILEFVLYNGNGEFIMQNGILSGLRVIDCGTYVAGPASTTIMSDFGAEVVKIERPQGGDLYRFMAALPGFAKADLNWAWILTSRNKKSVALDLSSPQGRAVLIRLVKTADVFVTNYQHPLLAKFQLTWDHLQRENERLIYAHLTGSGDTGEDADAPTFDALAYWARSGLMMSVVGRDGTPGGPRPGMGDHPTAVSLFGAIMLGLYHRERTGRG